MPEKAKASTGRRTFTFVEGALIFKEGDQGGHAFIIESGQVEISKQIHGQRVVLGKLGKHALFGEMALFDDSPRMATATAVKKTVCIVIPKHVFDERMGKADAFIHGLVRMLIANVRGMSERMELRAGEGRDESQGPEK